MQIHEIISLNEINMSPGWLQRQASTINATVGIEFEMIVKGAISEPATENSYENDMELSSGNIKISDVIEFFNDPQWNDPNKIKELQTTMKEDYTYWLIENIQEIWDTVRIMRIRDWITENIESDEIADALGIDINSKNHKGITRAQMHQLAMQVDEEERDNPWYESAWEEFFKEESESHKNSEAAWFHAVDLMQMSDVAEAYQLNWPSRAPAGITGPTFEKDGKSVVQDFIDVVGRKAEYSKKYGNKELRSRQSKEGFYIVEPDSSLNTKDDGDVGLEFIAPALRLADMLSDIPKVIAWAKSRGNYTSQGTSSGLHMNVSIDGIDQSTRLDYVKLALLLGDNYVLQEFERVGNSYCKSALDKVRANATMLDAGGMEQVMNGIRVGLLSLASKAIHNGLTNKYVSINNKGKYIEFRSPGGDWLEEDFNKLSSTLLRFVVALDAATDANKYKKEYATKLETLLSGGKTVNYYDPTDPDNDKQPVKFSKEKKQGWRPVTGPVKQDDTNTIPYFAKWSAGLIPTSELVRVVRQTGLKRKGVDPTEGMPMWLVSTRNGEEQTFVKAADAAGAIEAARHNFGLADPMSRSLYSDNSFEVQQRRSAPGPAPVASSTQDVQQNRAQTAASLQAVQNQPHRADGPAPSGVLTGTWRIMRPLPNGESEILHVLQNIEPNFEAAISAARDWASSEDGIRQRAPSNWYVQPVLRR